MVFMYNLLNCSTKLPNTEGEKEDVSFWVEYEIIETDGFKEFTVVTLSCDNKQHEVVLNMLYLDDGKFAQYINNFLERSVK